MVELSAQSEETVPDLSGATAATAAGVAALATGAIVSDVVTEPVEAIELAEEIEIIDVPEVVIETSDADLPAIDIEAIEPDVEPDTSLEAAPVILQEDLPDGEAQATVLETEPVEVAALDEGVVEALETPAPDVEVDLVEEMLADDIMQDVNTGLPEEMQEIPVTDGSVPDIATPRNSYA